MNFTDKTILQIEYFNDSSDKHYCESLSQKPVIPIFFYLMQI